MPNESKLKTCRRCHTEKPLSDFPKANNTSDGYNAFCKFCANEQNRTNYARRSQEDGYKNSMRERFRTYYKNNRARRDIVVNAYLETHPEAISARGCKHRAIALGLSDHFTAAEFRELCKKHGEICLACKRRKKLTADHIVPLIHGGRNTIDNIQPLCRSCNAKKHDHTIDYRNSIIPLFIQRLFRYE